MAEHRINMTANFSQYDTAIKNAINNMRQFGNVANAAGQSGNAGAMKFVKSLQNIDSQATTTRQRLAAMNTLLKEMEMQYNRLGTAARNGAFGRELQVAIDQARSRVAAYNRELQGVGMASGGTSAFGAIFGGNLAARAAMDAIRLLGRTIKDAVRINAEFEYSNATLAAVLGVAKDEMLDLTEQAKKLGSASLYSANEITNLQIELARLGFSKREIKDSTDAIAKLALATGVDLSKAATLTGSTLRAFGYDTKEAARVASVLGVSTTKSALNMEKLSTALGYASVVSRQAGLDIEDTVAILGKLVDNGLQATTAGVGIRNIFMDLSDKSSKLSKAIKKVTGRDNISGLDEFIAALKEMRDAGMSMEDIASIIQRRVTPAFLNMLVNTEGITELRNDLKGCESELDNMASKMEDTLTGSSKKLKNAWEGLMLSFAEGNGILQETVVKITNLVNAIKRYNSITSNNTSNQLSYYKKGIDKNEVSKYTKKYQGLTQEEVIEKEADRIELIQKNYDRFMPYLVELNKLEKNANAFNALPGTESSKLYKEIMEELDTSFGIKSRKELIDYLSELSDKIDTSNAIIENFAVNKKVSISGNEGLGLAETLKGTSKSGKTKSRFEQLSERIAKAEDSYAISLNSAAIEVKNGSMTEKEYLNRKLSATQQLYRTYVMVISEIEREIENNPALKGELTPLLEKLKPLLSGYVSEMTELSGSIGVLVDLTNKQVQDEKESEALRKYNAKIVKRLSRYANRQGIGFEAVGLNNIDLTKAIDFQAIVDALNKFLAANNLKINLDLETGNIEEIKFSMQEALGQFDSKVGAFATVINSVDNIKSSFESLTETINSDASVWDKWFAVFNFGIGVLQTVIGVLQAIETLKDANIMLSEAQTAANAEEAASNLAVAGTASAEASANAGAAVTGAASSVAGIPVVGPLLAVAAIASVVAAILSAFKKTEYRAQGGIAGDLFTPRGTDTIPAMLSPGELILNRSQQASIASQLQGQGYGAIQVYGTSRISGGDILIALDNTNRARGGSRGTYAYSK